MSLCFRPPEGGMTESQSWVTSRAQEMFQKSVPENWNPDRPYPDDHHDSRHNPQVIPKMRSALLYTVSSPKSLTFHSSDFDF